MGKWFGYRVYNLNWKDCVFWSPAASICNAASNIDRFKITPEFSHICCDYDFNKNREKFVRDRVPKELISDLSQFVYRDSIQHPKFALQFSLNLKDDYTEKDLVTKREIFGKPNIEFFEFLALNHLYIYDTWFKLGGGNGTYNSENVIKGEIYIIHSKGYVLDCFLYVELKDPKPKQRIHIDRDWVNYMFHKLTYDVSEFSRFIPLEYTCEDPLDTFYNVRQWPCKKIHVEDLVEKRYKFHKGRLYGALRRNKLVVKTYDNVLEVLKEHVISKVELFLDKVLFFFFFWWKEEFNSLWE